MPGIFDPQAEKTVAVRFHNFQFSFWLYQSTREDNVSLVCVILLFTERVWGGGGQVNPPSVFPLCALKLTFGCFCEFFFFEGGGRL